jgi:hypothetical protein
MSRKIAWVAVIALMFVNAVSLSAATTGASGSAISRSLIDFSTFEENIATVVEKDAEIHKQKLEENPQLDLASYGYYPVEFEAADWHLSNWSVELVLPPIRFRTICIRIANCNQPIELRKSYHRIGRLSSLPAWRFLSWAMVKPPFEFFVNYDDGQFVNEKNPAK